MSGGLAYLLPDDGDEIDFDLVISETHTHASELTSHPIEKGDDVTDHVRHNPIEVSLEVWVTNTPVQEQDAYGGALTPIVLSLPPKPPRAPKSFSLFDLIKNAIQGPPPPLPPPVVTPLAFPVQFDKVDDTHKALTALERSGGSLTVVTSTANYPNMVLDKVGYEKTEAGSGTFNLEFKEARYVTTSTVAAPAPAEPRGAPSVKKGSQATSTDPSASRQSLAAKILDGAKGALGL